MNSSAAFVPPKPKEFDMTAIGPLGSRLAAFTPTMFASKSGFCLLKFSVGGAVWLTKASTVNTASTAPAAPSKCPVAPFVDDTARQPPGVEDVVARSPNT